jgi:uncharacterized membrane protein YeaQ/YmgE (transglycosylase-associated protein family)
MIVLVWIGLGLIAGLVAGRLSHHTGTALVPDIALSVAGAIAGGLAANSLGALQPATFITFGLLGAAVGSVATLLGYRAIFRRA